MYRFLYLLLCVPFLIVEVKSDCASHDINRCNNTCGCQLIKCGCLLPSFICSYGYLECVPLSFNTSGLINYCTQKTSCPNQCTSFTSACGPGSDVEINPNDPCTSISADQCLNGNNCNCALCSKAYCVTQGSISCGSTDTYCGGGGIGPIGVAIVVIVLLGIVGGGVGCFIYYKKKRSANEYSKPLLTN